MKRIAYIVYSDNHKVAFAKGFLNKSRHILSQAVQGLIPPWKASDFFDERLNDLGIIIAVGKFDFGNENSLHDIWSQIFDLCAKYHIDAICAAEIDPPSLNSASLSFPVFQDKTILFIYKIMQGYLSGKIDRNSQTAILAHENIDIKYVKYLSDKQNYIYIYQKNKSAAQKIADEIYSYNGTAAQITDNFGTLKKCDVIVVFDEKMQTYMNYFPKHISIINPYLLSGEEKKQLETKVYTNKLGEMQLNASFIESLFFVYNNSYPIDDLAAIEKIAENRIKTMP